MTTGLRVAFLAQPLLYVGDRLRSLVEGPWELTQRALPPCPAPLTHLSARTSDTPLRQSAPQAQKAATPEFRLANYRATYSRLRLAYRTTIPCSVKTLVRSDYLHGL